VLGASDAIELTQLLLVGSDLGVNAPHVVGVGDVVLQVGPFYPISCFLIRFDELTILPVPIRWVVCGSGVPSYDFLNLNGVFNSRFSVSFP
jgi:hypothetical protein